MNKFLILSDTRQQKENHITKVFEKENIPWQKATLSNCGDYMAIRYDDKKGIYKDFSILIDTKKDLTEMAHNLCNANEHSRLKKEILNSKELGCEKFCFLIGEDKIKTSEDIRNWSSPHTKVKGETLYKIMATMKKKYDIHFIICPKKEMGKKIIDLLTS